MDQAYFLPNTQAFTHPSFYAHILNGLLFFFAVILVIQSYRLIRQMSVYHQLVLILLFAVVIGIHGLSHLGLEKVYGFF
jgi:hypothetical protein